GHDANPALRVDVAGHDPDLASAGRDDPRRVGSDDRRRPTGEIPLGSNHVLDRDAVGDYDRDLDAGVHGLQQRIGGHLRRREDPADVRAGLAYGLLDAVEDREVQMRRTPATRGDAADDLGAEPDRLLRVERGVLAREPLDDHQRLAVHEHAHAEAPSSAATALAAASSRSSAWIRARPLLSRIARPSSTFVPARRTTTGTEIS